MASSEPVLVDTSHWIQFFNRSDSKEAASVEAVIREDRAALTGIVLAELLRGARTEEEASHLQAALGAVAWVQATRSVYTRAGRPYSS